MIEHQLWPADGVAIDLALGHVTAARNDIPSMFLNSPQYETELLNSALGCRVTVKLETANPLRCFKGRGVSYALRGVTTGDRVVCASSGNFGQAVAFVGRARGASVTVYAPAPINPVKRMRMISFGADVVEISGGAHQARCAAAAAAANDNAMLLIDGVQPAIAEGAATIAEELTREPAFDSIVAPIGDGSLIAGLALWFRAHSPATRIIGVNPAAAPAMHHSWRAGEPVSVMPESTFGEGITIPRPHPESLARVVRLVDDIVLVRDDELRQGMRLVADHLSTLVEPAGAAGIAAILAGRVAGERVTTVITGANPHPEAIRSVLGSNNGAGGR